MSISQETFWPKLQKNWTPFHFPDWNTSKYFFSSFKPVLNYGSFFIDLATKSATPTGYRTGQGILIKGERSVQLISLYQLVQMS
jgi:hypothetical protein